MVSFSFGLYTNYTIGDELLPTFCVSIASVLGASANFTIGNELWSFLLITPSFESGLCPLVHLRGLEPRTH